MDDRAFSDLYGRHLDDVWRFVRRRTSSTADADDATAEVFAVAWRRRSELPAEERLWLLGTARRVLANQRRSAERWALLHERAAVAGPPGHAPDPADAARPEPDPLWRALATLGAADRDLLLMRAWDGLSVTEIASLIECTPNATSIRLHRARARLADRLRRQAGQKDPVPGRTSPGWTPTAGGEQ